MMFGKKKPVFICGQCMQKFDPATVKLSEVGQMHKDICPNCGADMREAADDGC